MLKSLKFLAGTPPTFRPRRALGLLVGTAAAALLSACETDIEVPEPEHEPRVAVAYVLDANPASDKRLRELFDDRVPFVSVSQRLFDSRQLEGSTNATIEVRDGAGAVVERYKPRTGQPGQGGWGGGFNSTGRYEPLLGYTFRPGSSYTLRVSALNAPTAESRVTLPATVAIAEASLTPLRSTDPYNQLARLSVSFDDPSGAGNYYLVYALLRDANDNIVGAAFVDDETDGAVNVSRFRLSQPGSYSTEPFSDSGFDGRRLTLTNNVRYYVNNGGTFPGGPGATKYLDIVVSHITRDLYLFYNSRRVYQDNDGNPFAEPTPLYSNIEPGFGIFGGATDAVYRITL
ncbi:DUF4249 domain-containing protein [Hymenobacter busanensis]|uniref:DUF4249 domain-containing protein n=1 Tax=Hymenobacter busanensis TaxID=2607656 RepID=A0A7L4ZVM1_9BACT|nr:DUF4249 domain-containing protein [Hymenobacter busanensis]KAA9332142.1 DUF4249 domain-containing protein [Hymenobacter busanensis]QHJ07519.1 DUF4249 family protein [Hymenobacter busanensis]